MSSTGISSSISSGFKLLADDVAELFKMIFTKKGLTLFLLCLFIYLVSLYANKGVGKNGLIIAMVSLVMFLFLTWYIWFRPKQSSD